MDEEMAAAFNRSTAVSTHKGIGANLLRVGIKRRRTKIQIANDKEEAELRELAVNKSLLENEQLKQQVE